MIDRKTITATAQLLHDGLGNVIRFLENDAPRMAHDAGERLGVLKCKKSGLGKGVGVALGLLGAAAVAGLLFAGKSSRAA